MGITRTLAAALAATALLGLTACGDSTPTDAECTAIAQEHLRAYGAGETTVGLMPTLQADHPACIERMRINAQNSAPTAPAPLPAPAEDAAPATPTAGPTAVKPSKPAKPRDNSERDWSCDNMGGGITVCEGDPPASVGDYMTPREYKARQAEKERSSEGDAALKACQEQTGMTRDECIADAAAGNAS